MDLFELWTIDETIINKNQNMLRSWIRTRVPSGRGRVRWYIFLTYSRTTRPSSSSHSVASPSSHVRTSLLRWKLMCISCLSTSGSSNVATIARPSVDSRKFDLWAGFSPWPWSDSRGVIFTLTSVSSPIWVLPKVEETPGLGFVVEPAPLRPAAPEPLPQATEPLVVPWPSSFPSLNGWYPILN